MAYTVMAYIEMAYVVLAYTVMAYTGMAYVCSYGDGMASTGTAYLLMTWWAPRISRRLSSYGLVGPKDIATPI